MPPTPIITAPCATRRSDVMRAGGYHTIGVTSATIATMAFASMAHALEIDQLPGSQESDVMSEQTNA